MRRRPWLMAAITFALVSLVAASSASAGQGPTLHPSGAGPHTYASWKAKEGLPDSRGNDFQSLYMQKMAPAGDFSAAVVLIKGFEGLPLEKLEGL